MQTFVNSADSNGGRRRLCRRSLVTETTSARYDIRRLVEGGFKMQGAQLRYVIKFVADMDKAVKFHRDVLGLKLKFESPGWSEFATGETTLALHPASDKNPAGKVELGFTVPNVEAFYRDMSAKGVLFSMPPKKQDFGGVLAQFVDSEGAHCSVGAEAA
jgi:predicted enzyme related to lactoylglutathione lyase